MDMSLDHLIHNSKTLFSCFSPFYRPQTPPPEDDALREEQWSSSHPATMAACPTAALASASEMNQETYQVHYEQLLQMQRDQETRRLNQDLSSAVVMGDEMGTPNNKVQHSFSSQPTSRFTLDSASAEFAATAVRSTAQLETSVVKSSSEPNFGIVSSLSNLVTSSANIASVTTVVSDAAVTIPSSSLISSISAVTQSLASLPSSTHSSIMVAKPQIASSASSSVTLSLPQMLVSASSTLPSVVSVFTPSLLQSHPPRHLLLQTAAGQQLATCNGPITASPVPSSLSSPSSLLQSKLCSHCNLNLFLVAIHKKPVSAFFFFFFFLLCFVFFNNHFTDSSIVLNVKI